MRDVVTTINSQCGRYKVEIERRSSGVLEVMAYKLTIDRDPDYGYIDEFWMLVSDMSSITDTIQRAEQLAFEKLRCMQDDAAPDAAPNRSRMETMEPPTQKPSLILWGMTGYLVAALIGAVIYWFVAAHTGSFDNQTALALLTCFGAPGAFEGYRFAARQRKRLGVDEPSDVWNQFFGSWSFYFLGAFVLGGSCLISVVESLLFDLVYGAQWLQN